MAALYGASGSLNTLPTASVAIRLAVVGCPA